MKATLILTMVSMVIFTSCTKEIDLDLNTTNTKYVVEGQVPQNATANVKITKTVNFNESNNLPTVSNAKVSITDNTGMIEQLTETTAGIYETRKMVGEVGKTYTLTIVADGKTFTSKCAMPTPVKLTGLNPQLSSIVPPGGTASNYIIYPQFTDPPTLGNSYQFIQSTTKKTDTGILITNDNIGNGQPYTRPIFSNNFDIKLGDVVTVEFRCIDKAVYDYFFTINSIVGDGLGGGTTPSNPVNNITGGALGYFSVFTTQKMSVVVK